MMSTTKENQELLNDKNCNENKEESKRYGSITIDIHRPVYTQDDFDQAFGRAVVAPKSAKNKFISYCKKECICTPSCVTSRLLRLFPFIHIMRHYQWKNWLVSDIIAGLCVGVIHIPQSMGFSLLTALPAIYGLYSTIYPILIYFFFGTSRHISVGTMAVISLMIGAVVEREAANFVPSHVDDTEFNITQVIFRTNDTGPTDIPSLNPDEELIQFKVDIATSVTLVVGLVQLAMYLLNLGILASFMSMSFIGGFMTGAACHIVTSQVPFMLGIKPPRQVGAFRLPKTWYWIFRMMGDTNIAELIISLLCIVILVILKEIINEKYKKKLKVPVPAELIVVGLGIIISYFAKLNERFDVRIIANVPTGLPAPKAPSMYNVQSYISDAFAISLVSYALNMSLAKTFAQRFQYDIDQNQELFASGLVHFISSFFYCFGGAQAPPRTLVHVNTGGKTQVGSLVSMLLVLLVCIFIGPLIEPLPNSVLAAIITVALIPLFRQFKDLPGYFRINRQDFFVWVVSFLAVVIIDVDFGLYIGIGVSLLVIVLQTKFAKGADLSQAGHTELFSSPTTFKSLDSKLPASVKVFRFESPLCFANVENFKSNLFANTVNPRTIAKTKEGEMEKHVQELDVNTNNVESLPLAGLHGRDGVAGIVLDCSVIFYIDLMGLTAIKQVKQAYDDVGIRLVFANCNEELRKKMELYEIYKDACCYPSIQDAAMALCS